MDELIMDGAYCSAKINYRYYKHLDVLAASNQEKRDKGTLPPTGRHPALQTVSPRASNSRLYLCLRCGVSPKECCLHSRSMVLIFVNMRHMLHLLCAEGYSDKAAS